MSHADTDSARVPLDNTRPFEHAYGASFYYFDACGDGLSGGTYRRALVDKLMHCPFTDAAKARFAVRAGMQSKKARELIRDLIEQTGGLPVRLEGMRRTCREQMDSPEYRELSNRLEAYEAGSADRDDVVPAACSAIEITPDAPR